MHTFARLALSLGLVILAAGLVGGCSDDSGGGNACVDACKKLESCNPGTTCSINTGACTGQTKQIADCINAASCADTVKCLLGPGTDQGTGQLDGSSGGCPGGDKCVTTCPQGGCTSCVSSGTCNASCETGNCPQTCAGSATCNFSCGAGGCTQTCKDAATCNMSCEAGGCTQVCATSGTCVKTCTGGGCQ